MKYFLRQFYLFIIDKINGTCQCHGKSDISNFKQIYWYLKLKRELSLKDYLWASAPAHKYFKGEVGGVIDVFDNNKLLCL